MDTPDSIIAARPGAALSVSISYEVRTALATLAVQQETSMAALVEQALRLFLIRQGTAIVEVPSSAQCLQLFRACWKRYPPLEWGTRKGKRRLVDQVYFLQAEETTYIKIGHSLDPLQRRRTLQQSCPFRLHMLASVYVAQAADCERYLHQHLHQFRIKGEWYALPAAFIAQLAQLRQH